MIKIYLSTILERDGMTQIELSRKTGIRPATINEIYNEKIERINLEYLSRICQALDCQLDDLLQYIPDEEYYKYRRRPEKKKS